MPQEAGLILWLAGNQFFAMDDVVQAFQKLNPGVSVGLITLPPGLIADAILAGGWRYEGKDYPGRPDVYASVNLGHLQKLRQAGLMDNYATYMHNEMQIMVAKGNPKRVLGIGDLARADVKTSMPNPVNEGIMQFYARKGSSGTASGNKYPAARSVTPARRPRTTGSPRCMTGNARPHSPGNRRRGHRVENRGYRSRARRRTG